MYATQCIEQFIFVFMFNIVERNGGYVERVVVFFFCNVKLFKLTIMFLLQHPGYNVTCSATCKL